jgi:hypothetical protein
MLGSATSRMRLRAIPVPDRRNVRVIEQAKVCASRVNRAVTLGIVAKDSGRTLIATSRLSFVSRARYLPSAGPNG